MVLPNVPSIHQSTGEEDEFISHLLTELMNDILRQAQWARYGVLRVSDSQELFTLIS